MKKLILILVLIGMIIFPVFSQTGNYTTNELFYLPEYGASGVTEYDEYNKYQEIADAQIWANKLALANSDNWDTAYSWGDWSGEGFITKVVNDLTYYYLKTEMDSSAELAGIISDETGSGALVFANTPTLVTPVLGAASATTINTLTVGLGGGSEATNTAIGFEAGKNVAAGAIQNTFVGYQAGLSAVASTAAAKQNTAVGYQALNKLTTGSRNSAMGYGALSITTTGGYNCAAGAFALVANTTGNYNSAMGAYTLSANTTGSQNSAMGSYAGRFHANGTTALIPNNSVYLGANTRGKDNNDNNSIVIGYEAIGLGANTCVLGSDAIVQTNLKGKVMIGLNADVPTARLHLPAGTATQYTAPLKLTAGTLLTNLELGAIEFTDDGTTGKLYITMNVAGTLTRVQIAP